MNGRTAAGVVICIRQLLQRNGLKHDPNLLNTGPQNVLNRPLILPGYLRVRGHREMPRSATFHGANVMSPFSGDQGTRRPPPNSEAPVGRFVSI
jgi:hypothetical protein